MRSNSLPGTGLQLSVIALGTGEFGGAISEAEAFAQLNTYVEAGGNFIDTANVYADWRPGEKSSSEKVIGRWLKESRAEVIVATKGGHPDLIPDAKPRLDAASLLQDVDASRRNLGRDTLDLYWLHRDDPQRPVGDILEILENLVRAGKIRHYAFSNWKLERAREARRVAGENGWQGFVASQLMWSLGKPEMQYLDPTMAEMTPDFDHWHEQENLAAVPYSSQAGGYFSKLARDPAAAERSGVYHTAANRERGLRAMQLAHETSLTVTQIVLGWLLSHPFPVFPIIGPKNLSQLQDSLEASDSVLTPEQLRWLRDGPA